MNASAIESVVEELRDVLEDDSVRVKETFEVWLLPEWSQKIRDARFVQQFHHQIWTSDGLTYARSFMQDHDNLDLHEIGNTLTASRIDEASSRLSGSNKRVLLVPSRQIIALWEPQRAHVVVIFSASEQLTPSTLLDERFFETRLAQIEPEIIDEPLLRDRDPWTHIGQRLASERGVGAA